MPSYNSRRNGDGSTSWDETVRVVGYQTTCRTFRTKVIRQLANASRTPASAFDARSGESGSVRPVDLL
jgi:hypothetical protein